jgi:hypothetical protein
MNWRLLLQLSLFGLAIREAPSRQAFPARLRRQPPARGRDDASHAFSRSPRLMMALMGPLIGGMSGVVLGLLAFVAGRLART